MRDFRTYGLLEAGNIIVVPGFALLVAPPQNRIEMGVMALAILACASFLYVGARYWLALDKRIKESDKQSMESALGLAKMAEKPFLGLTGLAVLSTLVSLAACGLSTALIAALILASFAVLEYVNYYHYQLMNFDQWNDITRLLRTGKLRRAHMARQLARFRKAGHI